MQAAVNVSSGADFTLDLNGHRLRCVGPFVGSTGTETNAMRLEKGCNVTIKNGTIDCIAPGVTILIQNFANLTLDNVVLKGKRTCQYLLSNNCGNIVLRNGTTIKGSVNTVPFDVHYGLLPEYDDGVTVTIEDSSVVIEGNIEYTKEDRITDNNQFYSKAHLYIPVGYTGVTAPAGYEFKLTENGKQKELVATE